MISLRRLIPAPLRPILRKVLRRQPAPDVAASPQGWERNGFKWTLEQVLTNRAGLAAHAWFAAPKSESPHLALGVNGEPFPAQERRPRPDVVAEIPALRQLPTYEVVGVTGHCWNPP